MPRIAASFGALVLIVLSIGFNMARYPKVWEMVSTPSQLPQPDQPDRATQPEALPETVSVSQTEPSSPSPGSWQMTPIALPKEMPSETDMERTLGGRAALQPSVDNLPEPTRADRTPSSIRYASLSGSIDPLCESASSKPLVPVARSSAAGMEPKSGDSEGTETIAADVAVGKVVDSDRGIRRLPPVGEVASVALEASASDSPNEPIPFYPSTGIR
ncbi:MAG: hypothetical protein JXB62_02380 [Pirellulales bacterium]|nr:hypothetical protein [Pirellulales bacterium]